MAMQIHPRYCKFFVALALIWLPMAGWTTRSLAQQDWDHPLSNSASPSIAVVVMDLGYQEDTSRLVFDLPSQVALAWAPEGRLSKALAAVAHQRGHLLLAQIYMRSSESPEHSVTFTMDRAAIQKSVDRTLAAVPFVGGLLPLQSTEFSADDSAVHRFTLAAWKHRPLVMVDPRTSQQSQIYTVARQYQLVSVRRDIFLEHSEPAELETGWQEALELAHTRGSALVMVPAEKNVLLFLQQRLAALPDQGLRLIDLNQLANVQSETVLITADHDIQAGKRDEPGS